MRGICCLLKSLLHWGDAVNESEQKKTDAYEKRSNAPYVQMVIDQLLLVDDALLKRDRERTILNLQCTLSLISVYVIDPAINQRLKKRILGLVGITTEDVFFSESKEIQQNLLEIIGDVQERNKIW